MSRAPRIVALGLGVLLAACAGSGTSGPAAPDEVGGARAQPWAAEADRGGGATPAEPGAVAAGPGASGAGEQPVATPRIAGAPSRGRGAVAPAGATDPTRGAAASTASRPPSEPPPAVTAARPAPTPASPATPLVLRRMPVRSEPVASAARAPALPSPPPPPSAAAIDAAVARAKAAAAADPAPGAAPPGTEPPPEPAPRQRASATGSDEPAPAPPARQSEPAAGRAEAASARQERPPAVAPGEPAASQEPAPDEPEASAATPEVPSPPPVPGDPERLADLVAELVTDHGTMVIGLRPDVAPRHVAAFVALAEADFYDGLTFHRVVPGFIVHGGCPDGDGTGGPGWTLDAEPSEVPHVRGTVSAARHAALDSAGSQFMICLADAPELDGRYTVFGKLIAGDEVLEAISRVETGAGHRPREPLVIRSLSVRPRRADEPNLVGHDP